MTKKEFIQQACLDIIPILCQHRCDAIGTKTSFRSVFTCADLIEQVSEERGTPVFDDEQPSAQHPYAEYDNIPITNLYVDNSGGARTRFLRVCREFKIKTIGDLLRVGSRSFRKFRDIGNRTYHLVRKELELQYSITNF